MMKKCDIEQLERQGCFSDDWSRVAIAEGSDLGRIRNVYFKGEVSIGKNPEIINVPGGLSGIRIGDNVKIVDVARIEKTGKATLGIGTEIAVLDETGKRPVTIYPGLSAQIAAIATRMPGFFREKLRAMINRHIASLPDMPEIGDGAEVMDCGVITDVRIWPGAMVEGATRLHNGSIVNNATGRGIAYVGYGVDAENFIIEDGMVSGGSLLRNVYVGQGSVIDKGFTAHDSLFFANCSMENGEACAVLAGPFTVSMHKSSLLIGCQTSFMNAGSGTNMSNHMYKTGPEHWGVFERGVKTSSNCYIMHGSRIGAYSLVMGDHKKHPDTSCFPFSYLFGDEKGNTTVVPGAMLGSYGLKRDEEKWPKRDRRLGQGIPLHDRISYGVYTPYMVGLIENGINAIDHLLSTDTDENGMREYKGVAISERSIVKGHKLYMMALCKFIKESSLKKDITPSAEKVSKKWIDVSGQIMPESRLESILGKESIEAMEKAFDEAAEEYDADERRWLADYLGDTEAKMPKIEAKTVELDGLIEQDRKASLERIANENEMLSSL